MNNWRESPKEFLVSLFKNAVNQALPYYVLPKYLPKLNNKGKTIVIGAGKAAGSMAQTVESLWQNVENLSGIVVTRYGHIPKINLDFKSRINIRESSHPIPDKNSLNASLEILNLVKNLTEDDLVLCLISGGGSSLLSLPIDGLNLKEKQNINQQLLDCGASISEINCIRKHLSKIKGGKLAEVIYPAKLITLAISDVPNDDFSVIASGPTFPDLTTCKNALEILNNYQIKIPNLIYKKLENNELETPKLNNNCFKNSEFKLIANSMKSLESSANLAIKNGLNTYILSDEIEGESSQIAKMHAGIIKSIIKYDKPFEKPCLILSGGETTVTLNKANKNNGKGGRSSEFILSLLNELKDNPKVWALATDTDGIDGIEDNAGAFITPESFNKSNQLNLSIKDYLNNHDSYNFFKQLDSLIITGPTFTNVNDFRAILILD